MTIVAGTLVFTVAGSSSGEPIVPLRATPTDVAPSAWITASMSAMVISGPVHAAMSWPQRSTEMYLLLCCDRVGWVPISWIDHVIISPGE